MSKTKLSNNNGAVASIMFTPIVWLEDVRRAKANADPSPPIKP